METFENWSFSPNMHDYIFWSHGIFIAFIERLMTFFTFFGFLLIIFGCTAIVTRHIILYLPAPFILICELLRIDFLSESLCWQFPWIGNYVQMLKNNEKSRSSRIFVCSAMIALVIVFLLLYFSFCKFSIMIIFQESYPKNIDYMYYSTIISLDILALLHIRSRISLLIMPIFTVISHICLLYYLKFHVYPFHQLAILTVFIMNLAILFGLTVFVEWRLLGYDETYSFVPSLQKPRLLFQSLFATTWIEDTPPIWTIFMDNEGRNCFNSEQLALIDGDFSRLRGHLRMQNETN